MMSKKIQTKYFCYLEHIVFDVCVVQKPINTEFEPGSDDAGLVLVCVASSYARVMLLDPKFNFMLDKGLGQCIYRSIA